MALLICCTTPGCLQKKEKNLYKVIVAFDLLQRAGLCLNPQSSGEAWSINFYAWSINYRHFYTTACYQHQWKPISFNFQNLLVNIVIEPCVSTVLVTVGLIGHNISINEAYNWPSVDRNCKRFMCTSCLQMYSKVCWMCELWRYTIEMISYRENA